MLVSIILFLVVFSLVVLTHELGHFWAARFFGVAIDEFGIGLPPRLWRKKNSDFSISIGAIPIGGYVRLRSSEGKKKLDKSSLEAQPPLVKMIVSLSGIFMNLVLAFIIFLFGFWLGLPPIISQIDTLPTASAESAKVQVIAVRQDSPAEKVGILPGDYILQVGDEVVKTPDEVSEFTASSAGRELTLLLLRKSDELTVKARPRWLDGRYSLGVVIDTSVLRARYAWWATPYLALLETGKTTQAVVKGFGALFTRLFTEGQLADELRGPVGIAQLTGEVASLGFFRFLQFIILLTINLAILNILPLPALDGGRFLFGLAERITRRRLKAEVENAIHLMGFVLIIVLVIVVTYRDIIKLF